MRSEKIRRDGDKGGVYLNKLTFSASQCKALGIRDHTETHSHTHTHNAQLTHGTHTCIMDLFLSQRDGLLYHFILRSREQREV